MIFHWVLVAATIAAGTDEGRLDRYQQVVPSMGSTFQIVLYAPNESAANRGFEAAFARVAELNQIFSDYEIDSEASRLSRLSPMDTPVPVSPDMSLVLRWSLDLSRQTDGAFDVTVGPLTKLWRRARRQGRMPSSQRLLDAQAAVGYQHVILTEEGRKAKLAAAGMRLDFGGVVKGYAGDEALKTLREQGIHRVLVNGGGDMTLGDPPPDRPGWRIGVAPLDADKLPSRILYLSNCGVATSGDAWQFVEIDGTRYSHIVDSKTGLGLTDRTSVTVIARDGMTADGLASAISVLGPENGLRLVEEVCGAAAAVVRVEGEAVKTYQSKRFAALDDDTVD